MDYRITCICGHTFQVPEERLKSRLKCPACGQPLNAVPDVASSPPKGTLPPSVSPGSLSPVAEPANAPAEQTKRCPFCGEVILAIARKCKHCGEFLDRSAPTPAGHPFTAGASAVPTDPQAGQTDVSPTYALSVSQWDNFWKIIILLTFAAAIIWALWFFTMLKPYKEIGTLCTLVFAGFIAWFFVLSVKNTRFMIRPTRIDTEQGILSKDINSLELFRVIHVDFKQTLIERILGVGTINLMTADDTEPELVLYQIPRAREVLKYIQAQIPIAARLRGAVYVEK